MNRRGCVFTCSDCRLIYPKKRSEKITGAFVKVPADSLCLKSIKAARLSNGLRSARSANLCYWWLHDLREKSATSFETYADVLMPAFLMDGGSSSGEGWGGGEELHATASYRWPWRLSRFKCAFSVSCCCQQTALNHADDSPALHSASFQHIRFTHGCL